MNPYRFRPLPDPAIRRALDRALICFLIALIGMMIFDASSPFPTDLFYYQR